MNIGRWLCFIILHYGALTGVSYAQTGSIAVIGAGLAGLTFAHRLQEAGQDVTVYEARSRVGGRIKTAYIKNLDGNYSLVELGGQNIADGGGGRHILALAKELDIEVISIEQSSSQAFYDGKTFYNPQIWFTDEAKKNLKKIQKRLKPLAKKHTSVQTLMDTLFSGPCIFPQQGLIKRFLSLCISSYEGALLSQLSATENVGVIEEVMQWNFRPHPFMQFKQGASTLPMALAARLGNRIHLNHVLKSIALNGDKIELIFQDGKTVFHDKVILAIPAPCYQDIQFSEATLPKNQLDLIKKIPPGSNAKAVVPIKYSQLPYNFIFSDNLAGLDNTVESWLNADKKLLTLYFRGDDGRGVIEKLYPIALDLVKLCYYHSATLNEVTPLIAKEENFAHYDAPVIQTWVQDPYSRGSYSSFGVGLNRLIDKKIQYKGIQVRTIFSPVSDRVFFIGEHTATISEVGTMEAAVESAEQLAKLFTGQKVTNKAE